MQNYNPGDSLRQEEREAGFKDGLPRFLFDASGVPAVYQIIVAPGTELKSAFVDASTQYSGEGAQWQDANTREYIPRHRVIGWRDVNSDSREKMPCTRTDSY